MYNLNNWLLSNPDFVDPAPGEAPVAGREFVTIDVPDLSSTPLTNLTNGVNIADSDVGNTLEVVYKFDDNDTGAHTTLFIEDGTNKAGIEVFKGGLRDLTGSTTVAITNLDGDTHRYTLTLKNGVFSVLFDTVEVYSATVAQTSTNKKLGFGFFETQTGQMTLNIKYIKKTRGIYKYIKPSEIDFELQIDSTNTFDSVNLHTYTKSSFENIPDVPDDWDPVSIICGNYTGDGYDFNGLTQAVAVHLPVRQFDSEIPFYYRVRFVGDHYTSDWSNIYLVNRIKPTVLTPINPEDIRKIALEFTEDSNKYHAILPSEDGLGILLPEIPTTNGLTFTIYNASTYNVKLYSHQYDEKLEKVVYFNQFDLSPNSISNITYDEVTEKWYLSVKNKETSFVLPLNIANLVFTSVFQYHLPAYDFVYTKAYSSGDVANFVRANAYAIDDIFNTFEADRKDIDSFSANRDAFNERWKNVFGLDNSLFKNSADMRDIMQCLLANLNGQLLKAKVAELICDITGAKPFIAEYKDIDFNILGDKSYYIYDKEHPLYGKKPFILYGGRPKAFTWEINVFDPYNLQYDFGLVLNILDMFKPVYSYVVVNFYNYEGRPIRRQYVYGYDLYGEAAYTPDGSSEPPEPNDYLLSSSTGTLAWINDGIFTYINTPQILDNTFNQ